MRGTDLHAHRDRGSPPGKKVCVQSGDPPADECPPASLAVCPPKCDTAAVNLDACAALCDQLGYK